MRQRTIPTPVWAASKSRKDLKLHMWNTAFHPLITTGVHWRPSTRRFLVARTKSRGLKLNPFAHNRGKAEQDGRFTLKPSSQLRIFTCQLHWGVLEFLAFWPRGSQRHNIDTGEPTKKSSNTSGRRPSIKVSQTLELHHAAAAWVTSVFTLDILSNEWAADKKKKTARPPCTSLSTAGRKKLCLIHLK